MFRFKKISLQLQLILSLLVLCGIAGFGFAYFTTAKTSVFKDFREKFLLSTLKASQSSFQSTILRAIETSELLADDPTLSAWFLSGDTNNALKTLSLTRLDYVYKNHNYATVMAVNRITKNYWSQDFRLLNVVSENDSTDAWFFDSIKRGVKTSLNFDYNSKLKKTMLFVNVLMVEEGSAFGVAGVGIDIGILMEEFEQLKLSKNSCLWLVDSIGTVKLSSNVNEINHPLKWQVPEDVLDVMLGSNTISIVSDVVVGKQRVEMVSMPVGKTKFRLLMLVPANELFPLLGIIRDKAMWFSLLLLILTLIITRVLSRYIITQPLLRLKKQSEQWADGFLDVNSDSRLLKRKDEIGSLAKSFEIMRHRLANNLTELGKINDDLTKDKEELGQVNEQLKVAIYRAAESERLTQSFLANISHEIRTPMNSIMGFSQLLQQPSLRSEDQDYYVDIVLKSGSQLLSILDSIINLSKIESGVLKARWGNVNICELVNETCEVYRLLAEEKGLALICNAYQVNPHIELVSDPALIQMVLNNLISNAIKFTYSGSVEVRCDNKNGGVVIMVTDTGIGIAEKDMQYIFNPFRQVETLHASKTNGAGLGLAIVDKVVKILGGIITLETKVNEGSVFRVELPGNH